MNAFKFVLSSKKVIYLREPKIGDLETASQIAGKKASENQAYLSILLQKELLKTLLIQVDDKKLSLSEKENLDKLFNFSEYQQAVKAVSMVTATEGNELTAEFVNAGE